MHSLMTTFQIHPTISSIGYIDLFAGGAFGYVDGFAAGASITGMYSNVLFTLGYTMDNEQGGLEYVEEGLIPINYYKHYRIDNFPLMVGFYRPFRGVSLSASAGLSLLFYSEYVDVNTFSIFIPMQPEYILKPIWVFLMSLT